MTEEEFEEIVRNYKIEREIKHINDTDASIEQHFRDGDRVIFHQKHKIGEEEIDVDLVTVTQIQDGSVKGIDIANDATVRLDDESGDDAYGVSIEYCELNNITKVSRILINRQILDGVSTSYDIDGGVRKIEIYENGELTETILDD